MADAGEGGSMDKLENERATPEGIVAHCTSCRRESVFVRRRIRHLFHLVATILSGGIWLIGWFAICMNAALRPWRCKNCGWHKPEFRTPLRVIIERGESALRRRTARMEMKDDKIIDGPWVEIPNEPPSSATR